MVRNRLFATAVFTFVLAWNDFILARVMTRSELTTYPVQVTHYIEQGREVEAIAGASASGRRHGFGTGGSEQSVQ